MLYLQILCVCIVLLYEGQAAEAWSSSDYELDYDLDPEEWPAYHGQYRSEISWTPEGIPVRTIYPPGYEPPPQPPPRPVPPPNVATNSIQIADLSQSQQAQTAALRKKTQTRKRKKQKNRRRRPASQVIDPLEQEYEDYDEYRDQYDEEQDEDGDVEFEDVDTSSEELDDDDEPEDGSSEELDDSAAKSRHKKNKSKKKKNKNKKKQGQGNDNRPPPWEKYAPPPRPQRLQEVDVWGYQNEYNRGWGKNKKLAELQKQAWLAAKKREEEYREWFESLPEERQEAIIAAQQYERRRKNYYAYAQSIKEIGGLPIAPTGPSHDYFPPPGTPVTGTGGGWTTRLYRVLLTEDS